MVQAKWMGAALACLILVCPTGALAQETGSGVDKALAGLGVEAIRDIHFDICFPATAEEYQALGKNAIVKVESSSALSTELPLWSVYVIRKGVQIPLARIVLLDKRQDPGASQTTQISFYLLPI